MIIVDLRIRIEGDGRKITGKLSPQGETPGEKTLLRDLSAEMGLPGNQVQKLLLDLCGEKGIAAR